MIKYLLFLFCLCVFSNVRAQSIDHQADSILDLIERENSDSTIASHYLDLGWLFLYSKPEQSVQYAHKALSFGNALNNFNIKYNALAILFTGHYNLGASADTILKCLKLQEKLVEDSGEEEFLRNLYWGYAMYYSNVVQHDKEIEYYLKALEITRNLENEPPDNETGLLNNIAVVLLEQKKYQDALRYLLEGLRMVEGDGLKATMLHNAAESYENLGHYDTALVYYRESYQFYEKVNDLGGMAISLIGEAIYYDVEKQYERANQLYNRALDLIETSEFIHKLPFILNALATHYQVRGNHSSTIDYGEQSLKKAKSHQLYSDLEDTYTILQKSYAAIGDYQRAFEIRGEQMAFRDSVSSAELKTKVEALHIEYEVEQKEAENEMLKTQALVSKNAIQIRNITALALSLGLLLLGSWALTIFRANRRKQQYNEELEVTVAERTAELNKSNKELEQANYELKTFNYIASHDIKEPIRNIGSYAGLVYRKLPLALQGDFKSYFDTIKNSTTQLYTLVEDISRYSTMSKEDSIEMEDVDLNLLVENLKINLNHYIKQKRGNVINTGLPIIVSNASLMYTILKNLIENGLKFNDSSIPAVVLSCKEEEDYIVLFVKDNGIGLDLTYKDKIFEMFKKLHSKQDYEGSGIGLAISKLLIDKLRGTIEIESREDEGSTFILRLPK